MCVGDPFSVALLCDTGCPPFTVCIFLETSLLCDTGCPPFTVCIFLETYVLASLLCDTGCPPFTVCETTGCPYCLISRQLCVGIPSL